MGFRLSLGSSSGSRRGLRKSPQSLVPRAVTVGFAILRIELCQPADLRPPGEALGSTTTSPWTTSGSTSSTGAATSTRSTRWFFYSPTGTSRISTRFLGGEISLGCKLNSFIELTGTLELRFLVCCVQTLKRCVIEKPIVVVTHERYFWVF